jgi:hypothetical protein
MKRYGLTTDQVLGRFEIGYEGGTAAAQVPGGRRLEAVKDPGTGDLLLYSYRTIVAARRRDTGRIAVTPRRYSVTTSKVMGKLGRLLAARDYITTGEQQPISAAVPGRWGGFGPAWHATGVELVPFTVYAKRSTIAMEAVDGTHDIRAMHDRERDGLPTSAR